MEMRKEISEVIRTLWDNGIEVSHTIRDFGTCKILQMIFIPSHSLLETDYFLGF